MKRFVLIVTCLVSFLALSAQNNKKVAVMETKNIQGVSAFQGNIVRGGMETAVANAPGYEGYDRAAFDVIMQEQKFQRSGAVDDKQIREMGIMAGVQYVLVTEASTEDGYFYILAKLLDVETGRFMKSEEQLCEATPIVIKEACSKLGVQLFGGSRSNSSGGGTKTPQTPRDQDFTETGNEVADSGIFIISEEMPEFPGGIDQLRKYLSENIKYPKGAREKGIHGRVLVNFVVEPDGSVSNVKVVRSLGGGCDEEAMRVVKAMPKWKPGKQRGKAVSVNYTLPVNFKL